MVFYPQPGAQQGWQCPVCRSVYAPNTPQCLQCPAQDYTSPDTVPFTFTIPTICIHEYGDLTSGGKQCKKCGMMEPLFTPNGTGTIRSNT